MTVVNANKETVACTALQNFINLCNAQKAKKLAVAQADLLIGAVWKVNSPLDTLNPRRGEAAD